MQEHDVLCRAYARLLIREGVNLQPGQRLVLTCPVERADFARLCAEEAYAAGCAEVLLRWEDDQISRLKYLYAADAVFDRVNPWDALLPDTLSAEGAAWLAVHAEDPAHLKGVDPARIRRASAASGAALAAFRKRETHNEFPWCVCSVPTAAWARTVFPDLDEDAAMERLWTEIFRACRVTGGDAVPAWRAHSETLHRRVEALNRYAFRTLHYRNALGTDLTVELPEGHYWAGGAEKCLTSGLDFSANIPTEEVFTLPKRDGVNGVMAASRPLSLNGNIVEGLRLTLQNGKITDICAAQGAEIVRAATETDEGASCFGEVALVPSRSPISESGVLFYNTLFDENAACHFAFGDAYPCIHGAEEMSAEELLARGANSSVIHVDFMVGTPDLSIVGTTAAGETIPVFTDGNFAF
ncbi:MAG: aminopeptidase [Oscillospiraceae bacterium]|nr:aminopeptidase [Oscillospiraceae bacterium]